MLLVACRMSMVLSMCSHMASFSYLHRQGLNGQDSISSSPMKVWSSICFFPGIKVYHCIYIQNIIIFFFPHTEDKNRSAEMKKTSPLPPISLQKIDLPDVPVVFMMGRYLYTNILDTKTICYHIFLEPIILLPYQFEQHRFRLFTCVCHLQICVICIIH